MKVAAKAAVGDKAKILVGQRWWPCEVVAVWHWSHSSDNEYPAYKVRFADGSEMCCDNNSLKVRKK